MGDQMGNRKYFAFKNSYFAFSEGLNFNLIKRLPMNAKSEMRNAKWFQGLVFRVEKWYNI